MISEKKLAYYEYVASQTCSQECQKIINQLVSEVRKLNREAEWLAISMSTTDICANPQRNEMEDCGCEECIACWREQARRAVSCD